MAELNPAFWSQQLAQTFIYSVYRDVQNQLSASPQALATPGLLLSWSCRN